MPFNPNKHWKPYRYHIPTTPKRDCLTCKYSIGHRCMHPKVDTPQGYKPLDLCVLRSYELWEGYEAVR